MRDVEASQLNLSTTRPPFEILPKDMQVEAVANH
jgi:hypothetical protein